MRKIFSLLFIAVIFLLIAPLEGCKKYPNGPYLSFRSKTERVAGLWHFASVKVNGTEQNLTQLVNSLPPYENQSFEYTKGGLVVWSWDAYSFFPAGSSNGEWKFNSDKSKILVKMEGETEWKEKTILKLKNNEFWYKEINGINTTEVHLESN